MIEADLIEEIKDILKERNKYETSNGIKSLANHAEDVLIKHLAELAVELAYGKSERGNDYYFDGINILHRSKVPQKKRKSK